MAEKQGDILKEEPELWDKVKDLSDRDKATILNYLMGWGVNNASILESVKVGLAYLERMKNSINLCSK